MSESLIPLFLFVAVIALLPWLVRRLQSRLGQGGESMPGGRVISAVAVGPQQRVVTVQLDRGGQSLTLVLGVTSSSVTCLHTWEESTSTPTVRSAVTAGDVA